MTTREAIAPIADSVRMAKVAEMAMPEITKQAFYQRLGAYDNHGKPMRDFKPEERARIKRALLRIGQEIIIAAEKL